MTEACTAVQVIEAMRPVGVGLGIFSLLLSVVWGSVWCYVKSIR